ncbi:MAG: DUF4214 domain-containing protein [Desulfobacterales bacterium]|nr:MAG: DUF4214 domain-containing protein [Desulfobacterales bacterium]
MGNRKRILLFGLIGLIISLPAHLFALGEIDGVWIGLETISFSGVREVVTSGAVIYQEDDSTLYFFDDYFGTVELTKSGTQWILPSPLVTTYYGVRIVIESVSFTFPTSSSLTGTIHFTGNDTPGSASLSHSKQTCQVLTNGSTLPNLSGGEDSLQCYQVNLSSAASNLSIQTEGGAGDCDLYLFYYKPPFDDFYSEGDYNDEQILVSSPAAGTWYILLVGWGSYRGLSLTVGYDEIPLPEAHFNAAPLYGSSPLTVNFSDQSTGDITDWLWQFGDGFTSTQQHPTHTYAAPGDYTVALTVSGAGMSNTKSLQGFIKVWPDEMVSDIAEFVRLYYRRILDREPDAGGFAQWQSEIERISYLSIDIKEGFIALARFFFNSDEYLLQNKTNIEYVTDLYQTFFSRDPDQGGLNYWVALLDQGVSRNVILNYFVYSDEFFLYMTAVFGSSAALPECNLVNDLYRGLLTRLPETAGYSAWVSQMRTAMSSGEQSVRELSHQIALEFIQSEEYRRRDRDDREFLEDLYNGILRRGAQQDEFDGWLENTNAGLSHAEVLQHFTNSEEFQLRVQAIIDAAGARPLD